MAQCESEVITVVVAVLVFHFCGYQMKDEEREMGWASSMERNKEGMMRWKSRL